MGHIASSNGGGLSPSEVAVKIAYQLPEILCISGAHKLVDQGSPELGSGLKITRESAWSQLSVRYLDRLSVTLLFVVYVNRYQLSPSASLYLVMKGSPTLSVMTGFEYVAFVVLFVPTTAGSHPDDVPWLGSKTWPVTPAIPKHDAREAISASGNLFMVL
jgi:hypothetical protein